MKDRTVALTDRQKKIKSSREKQKMSSKDETGMQVLHLLLVLD